MDININTLLQWDNGTLVNTKRGCKLLKKAKLTKAFIALYRIHQEEFNKVGVSINSWHGKYEVVWWQNEPIKELKSDIPVKRMRMPIQRLYSPDGLDYLNYQKVAIRYCLERNNAILADDMGLGKTIQAIGVMNNTKNWKTAIIVCPKILTTNWQQELNKWLIKNKSDIVIANARKDFGKILIINYEKLKTYQSVLKNKSFDFVICDEAHNIKNPKAIKSKYAKSLKANVKTLRITGTPFLNKPIELFNLINDLDPINFGNYIKYAYRYCNAFRDNFGLNTDGHSNLDELQRILYKNIMIRRLKKDVLKDLPDKTRQTVKLEATKEQVKLLNEIEKLDINYRQLFDKPQFSEYAIVHHKVALTKVKQIIEYVTPILKEEPEKKLIIGAIHHDVEKLFYDGLIEFNPSILNGDTKDNDKQKTIDNFQNNPKNRVIICGIKAAGIGITLTASDWVVLSELDFVPGNMTQFEDRAHRIGQKNNVLVQHFVLKDSLDEEIVKKLISKQLVFDKALNKNDNEISVKADEIEKDTIIHLDDKKDEISIENEQKELILQKANIHKMLKILASYDTDRSTKLNGIGFNKIDTSIGNYLAKQHDLNYKQLKTAKKICKKYFRQLPKELVNAVYGI